MTSNDNNRLEDLLRKLYAEDLPDLTDESLTDIIDEEWEKFVGNEELRIKNEEAMPQHHSSFFILHSSFYKLAAAFIGLLLISGIAYAAIRIVQDSGNGQTRTSADSVSVRVSPLQNIYPAVPSDTIPPTRIFENVPLDEMVSEIARYYNKVADIQNPQAHELRFYFVWIREDGVEATVEKLNHFESVNIELTQDRLILK